MTKTKKKALATQPPTDEDLESEEDRRRKRPAAKARKTATPKAKKKVAGHQSDEGDSGREPMDVDDLDTREPQTKERASRKAKSDALSLRNWVETGRRKNQVEGAKTNEKALKTQQLKGGREKGNQPGKGRGGKSRMEDDADEPEELEGAEFGPVVVGSEESSDPGRDEDEPVVEIGSRRLRSAAVNPSKRKRANTESIEREDLEPIEHEDLEPIEHEDLEPIEREDLESIECEDVDDVDVRVHRNTTRAAAPAPRKPSVPSSSRSSQTRSTRTPSTNVTSQLHKTQQRKASSSQRSPGSDQDESSEDDAAVFQSTLRTPKPLTKKKKRALQSAAAEKPSFVDDGEDEKKPKKPAGPAEKALAANGRKPEIAGSDPLFQLLWKHAGKELKRVVFFVDPFPDSEHYEALPLDVYLAAIDAVNRLGYHEKGEVQRRAKKEYNIEWSSSLTHRLSALRAQLKGTTVLYVLEHFKKLGHNHRKNLLEGDEYWYKLSENGEAIRNAPFMHPVLQAILRKGLFEGRSGLYKIFPEEFEGEQDEKEMPAVLVVLAATFVYMALDAYVNNAETVAWNYNSSAVARVYHGHLDELKRIKSRKISSYHAILRKIFSNCVGSTPGGSGSTSKKTDYQNLPDSFSD